MDSKDDPEKLQNVALLAEGVDRNSFAEVEQVMNLQSPSSRRAWIEIQAIPSRSPPIKVALLAEGVDRNCMELDEKNCDVSRPPRGGRG